MKQNLSIFTACLMLLTTLHAYGEKADPNFIKEHLLKTRYDLDTDASAIVLDELVRIEVCQVSDKNYLYCTRKHVHKVIKLLKKSSFGLANEGFDFSIASNHYIHSTSGTVYNLDKENVVPTELEKSDFIKSRVMDDDYRMSFTFPDVKEGSVIEYSYDLEYPFWGILPSWSISSDYPKLRTSYLLDVPLQFSYTVLTRSATDIKEVKSDQEAFDIATGMAHTTFRIFTDVEKSHSLWVRKNVLPVLTESYVQNIENYRENMSLEPEAFIFGSQITPVKNTWKDFDKDLRKSANLGKDIYDRNNFFHSMIDSVIDAHPGALERTKAIFSLVRSRFTCSSHDDDYDKIDLRKIYSQRSGTEREINILLCAMLIYADLPAAPIYLSTTNKVSPSSLFPARDRYDYMAVSVTIDSTHYLLDASSPFSIFGELPPYCYNGYARVVDKNDGYGINLLSSAIKNKMVISVAVSNLSDSGGAVEMTFSPGRIISAAMRREWQDNPAARKKYLDKQTHSVPENFVITHCDVFNEQLPDTTLSIRLKGNFTCDPAASELIMPSELFPFMDQNPFLSAKRQLPVEFPYQEQFVYAMTVKLPDNWTISEVPPPAITMLDSNNMTAKKTYNYLEPLHLLSVNNNIEITTTSYERSDYASIREFFQDMIGIERQVITIKKKR